MLGFGLVALMQALFWATGADRAPPYREVQLVSLAATLALLAGLALGRDAMVAAGFAVNLLTRILQPVLGVTRLPLWITAILALGWALALVATMRGRAAGAGVWVLGAGHALALLLAWGRFDAAIALALGAAGLFLAAWNMPGGASASPGAREGRTG